MPFIAQRKLPVPMDARQGAPRRAYWLKTMHQWHWISSALCLVGMLLFAITGFTLNHAADIEAHPTTVRHQGTLPGPLLRELSQIAQGAAKAPHKGTPPALPNTTIDWLGKMLDIHIQGRPDIEWSDAEAYVSMPRPGGDAWVRIALDNGEVEYESTDRGWISYFNDLHKGRHAGTAWRWFIDIFAVACLVFCVTGLLILKFHATNRPSTWPLVAAGLVIPVLLALLFIH